MKKFFSLVAVATMVSMAACSNNASEEASTEMDSVANEVVETPTEEVAAPVMDSTATDSTTAPSTEAAK